MQGKIWYSNLIHWDLSPSSWPGPEDFSSLSHPSFPHKTHSIPLKDFQCQAKEFGETTWKISEYSVWHNESSVSEREVGRFMTTGTERGSEGMNVLTVHPYFSVDTMWCLETVNSSHSCRKHHVWISSLVW